MCEPFQLNMRLDDIEGVEEITERVRPLLEKLVDLARNVAPMERFEGFTFALDYDVALAEISANRGFGTRPLTRTDNEMAQGFAMAPLVLRDGVFKTHIVMSAQVLAGLLSGEQDKADWAIGAVLHELGHAAEHELFDACLPGFTGHFLPSDYEAIFNHYVEAAFKEYFACRVSAVADPAFGPGVRGTLIEALQRLASDVPPAKSRYRWTADMEEFAAIAFGRIGDVMKYAGYWLGHVDGLGEEPDFDAIKEDLERARFAEVIVELHAVFQRLWDRRGKWESIDEFFAVHRVMEQALRRYGLYPRVNDNGGVYIDVP